MLNLVPMGFASFDPSRFLACTGFEMPSSDLCVGNPNTNGLNGARLAQANAYNWGRRANACPYSGSFLS
jgi:hypothetical protein